MTMLTDQEIVDLYLELDKLIDEENGDPDCPTILEVPESEFKEVFETEEVSVIVTSMFTGFLLGRGYGWRDYPPERGLQEVLQEARLKLSEKPSKDG